ncbi:MAG: alpha/beta hydrolase [Myxococcales bacterium]|nr:alpha/beta hydrolase [Myxococcales bacterium]
MTEPRSSMAAPPPQPTSEDVFVERDDGASLFVRDIAMHHERALLILDGIGCSGWAFRRIIPTLAEHTRVLLMHYRGHGRSPDPPRPWHLSMPDLADDAAAVLEARGVGSAVVLGFSMGFQVALEVYRRHRTRVSGLVDLAGPSGRAMATFQGTDIFGHVLPLMRAAMRHAQDLTRRLWRGLVPTTWVQDLGALTRQINFERLRDEDFEIYLDQMAAMNPELFFEMLAEASRHTADDLLPQVRVPTLVIAGAHDRFVPLPTLRRIAFAIPDAQWVVIEDGTHALPAEYAEEIAERLGRFLAAVPQDDASS